ncbi:MAG: pancreas/duodenum homeobox protein 1 [Desulfobacterales bacterium]|nr:pancreas/duodenum homeobox protein 1 [Desulfobacterales bacterium]
MTTDTFRSTFSSDTLAELFPADLSNQFFEALYGDADEGAYDISLCFEKEGEGELFFGLHLVQRAGKCLACNLTYGLPEVFSRHPLINIKGLVDKIGERMGETFDITGWKLGHTREVSRELHIVPLSISFIKKG